MFRIDELSIEKSRKPGGTKARKAISRRDACPREGCIEASDFDIDTIKRIFGQVPSNDVNELFLLAVLCEFRLRVSFLPSRNSRSPSPSQAALGLGQANSQTIIGCLTAVPPPSIPTSCQGPVKYFFLFANTKKVFCHCGLPLRIPADIVGGVPITLLAALFLVPAVRERYGCSPLFSVVSEQIAHR